MRKQDQIIKEILKERERQDKKWGEQNHTPMEWLPILMEEVGEASKAALEVYFQTYYRQDLDYLNRENEKYRKEVIEIAAVALAMLESYERNK